MKIMQLLQQASKYFLIFLLLVLANISFADTKWEVATVFLDAHEDASFQKDIEENLKEIKKLNSNNLLKIGVYRQSLAKLSLSDYLKSFYQDQYAKKAIIIYSHGKGSEGLKDFATKELQNILISSAPHLDIAWFDACFMANIEFLYQIKNVSDFTVASEDAEFSSGLPFLALKEITKLSNSKDVALMLAKNYIESYSYLKKGSQRESVSSSAATISVLANKNLENFVSEIKVLKNIYNGLLVSEQNELKKTLTRKYQMENPDFVDLGNLVIELRKINKNRDSDNVLTRIIRKLNINSIKKLKTNPRIHIEAPIPGALMVFGFNDWKNGNQNEYSQNEIYSQILKSDRYIGGPKNNIWPAKIINGKEIILTPFAPFLNSFEYYFIDPVQMKAISESHSIKRMSDFFEQEDNSPDSPLIYTGYTQAIGHKAEKYTGINIAMIGSVPSLDYFELDFNQLTSWLSL